MRALTVLGDADSNEGMDLLELDLSRDCALSRVSSTLQCEATWFQDEAMNCYSKVSLSLPG